MHILKKLFLVVFITMIFIFGYLSPDITLESLKSNLSYIQNKVALNPIYYYFQYCLVYLLVAIFAIPGATILTLLSGSIFGLWFGFITVSILSTLGATLAFLLSRYFFNDYFQNKFKNRLDFIHKRIKEQGSLYIIFVRLIPVFPFFVANALFALTKIPLKTFVLYSWVGMMPITFLYVYLGQNLLTLVNTGLSLNIFIALSLVFIAPYSISKFVKIYKFRRLYKKPKHFDFNTVIIGGGSGGLVNALVSKKMHSKVALIEQDRMGGDCLNTGCVPSKTLINLANKNHNENVFDLIHQAIKTIEPKDSTKRYEKLGVTCIKSKASIISPYTIKVDNKLITTKNIIVATGAKPYVPNIKGLDNYLTSDTFWNLKELPKSIAILGAGPIGVELACALNRLGVKVDLIDKATNILSKEDKDVSEFIQESLEREGVNVHLSFNISHIENDLIYGKVYDDDKIIAAKTILVSMGRVSVLPEHELKNFDFSTNEYLQTNISNIFVIGDARGKYQFTHAAGYEGAISAINASFKSIWRIKPNYDSMPWITFTNTPVARVGINERDMSKTDKLIKIDFSSLDRAICDNNTKGFIKVIVRKDKILGATIVGKNASEIIHQVSLAMQQNIKLSKLGRMIYAYPSMSEILREVAAKNRSENTLLNYILTKWHKL